MYLCSNCGYASVKWLGKCPGCGEWESFYQDEAKKNAKGAKGKSAAKDVKLTPLKDIPEAVYARHTTGIAEFDRVLGGGLVKGAVVLVGGEPGIGKSTILIDAASRLARERKVLYISAEESMEQVSGRAKRLGISNEQLLFASEDAVENILPLFERKDVAAIVVDSIQVVGFDAIDAAKGSVVQVRESAHALTQAAKKHDVALFIVGHVTKEGNIAGPKLLEHIVDAVIYFEGERNSHFRILRAIKNRFGSVGEIGVFEMTSAGLAEVTNPSSVFISKGDERIPGRSIGCVLEGVRPLMIEAQALTAGADFGNARRRASGFNANRLPLFVAMLEKRLQVSFAQTDVFLNVAGGISVDDPSADLAAVAAIISAFQNTPLDPRAVFVGEVGLLGELRNASNLTQRLGEAQRLGFTRAFIPAVNAEKTKDLPKGLAIVPVKDVVELVEKLR
jgi:DNA repair protein RadA/Sms